MLADLADLQLPKADQQAAPRPGAERRQRDHYTHFVPLRSRIGDVDSLHYELGIFLDSTCLGVADAIGPRGSG